MKHYTCIIISLVILFLSCNHTAKKDKSPPHTTLKSDAVNQGDIISQEKSSIVTDSVKAAESKAIIKGRVLKFEGGDKYYYSSFNVLEVIANKTEYTFGDTVTVASYNWHKGIPENKECILYLVPWPSGSNQLNEKEEWMLMKGDGEYACGCK